MERGERAARDATADVAVRGEREGGGDRHAARALNLLKSEHAEDSAQVSRAERKPARRPQRCKKKKKRKKEKEKEKKKEKKKGRKRREEEEGGGLHGASWRLAHASVSVGMCTFCAL